MFGRHARYKLNVFCDIFQFREQKVGEETPLYLIKFRKM